MLYLQCLDCYKRIPTVYNLLIANIVCYPKVTKKNDISSYKWLQKGLIHEKWDPTAFSG